VIIGWSLFGGVPARSETLTYDFKPNLFLSRNSKSCNWIVKSNVIFF
jgi:hypothetical protein